MKNISVRVDDDFHKKVADQAKEQDMALSDFVRASLQAMCRHNEKHNENDPLINILKQQLTEKDRQIESFLEQQDQFQKIVAMQQQSIQSITSQNQLFIESSYQKKPSFWQRLIGQKI
tara:strand:- start:51 stop:404 length:354 start_codon:yes stop_codon:yes gene_type:complete